MQIYMYIENIPPTNMKVKNGDLDYGHGKRCEVKRIK